MGMVQYYRDMWPRRSHVLAPLIEAASGTKVRKILCNGALEKKIEEIKCMVSVVTLLSYPDWTIIFTVHTDASKNSKLLLSVRTTNPLRSSQEY